MSLNNDDFIVNKFTKRPIRRGGRAYINYMKKIKREEEDNTQLLENSKTKRKKKKLLQANGFSSDDSDSDNMPRRKSKPIPIPRKKQRSAQEAMLMLSQTLENCDDENSNELLEQMFEKLLNWEINMSRDI